MIQIKGDLKQFFFNSIKVANALERAEKRVLSKFGAYVRRADQTSLRYRKKIASPGAPPSAHKSEGFTRKKRNKKTGKVTIQPKSPLRELIYFGWDPATKSVLVGPVLFRNSKLGDPSVLRTIEEGGAGPGISDGKRVMKRYHPHPHLGPALRRELPKLPPMFKDSIR